MAIFPPSNISGKPRLFLLNSGLIVGAYGNICIIVWRAAPTNATAEQVGGEYGRMRSESPKFGTIIVVEEASGLPDERARKIIANHMDTFKSSMLCMGGVQEATGFRGAAIRSAMTAVNLLSTAPFPRTVTATVEECANWVVSHCPARVGNTPMSSAALVNAIAELRREAKGKGAQAS